MIITILAVSIMFLGLVCLFIDKVRDKYEPDWAIPGGILLILGGIVCLSLVAVMATNEMRADAYMAKFEAVRQSFEIARINEDINPYEIAAIQQIVAAKNEDLANCKFWAKHPLSNWFWSKRMLEIKPIK